MWVCGEAATVVDNLKDSEVLAGATDLLRSVILICLSHVRGNIPSKISHSLVNHIIDNRPSLRADYMRSSQVPLDFSGNRHWS